MEEEDWCKKYEKHKKEFSDYNLLGQSYRMLCQLTKTNFDKPEDVKQLDWVAKDVAKIIGELVSGKEKTKLEGAV
jgi:hypothetical protein